MEALVRLIGSPDLCSKRWIWEQYDHMVMADTVQRPGGDAALVRVHGTGKALAMTTDCTPRYCAAHPRTGGAQAVAEAWRNLTAVGARPLAITDCLNFGNPERPEVMGQLVGCIEGMAEACRALDFPVVSGNVSLYNETSGQGVQPTPAIGGVGLIADAARSMTLSFKAEGETILLLGATGGHLGASRYLRDVLGMEAGPPPPVDLAAERRAGDFVRGLIEAGRISACHDLSDGGLLIAVAEMAIGAARAGKAIGATLEAAPSGMAPAAYWYGEDQARYLLTAAPAEAARIAADAKAAGIPVTVVGLTGGASLTVAGTGAISLSELERAHEAWLPAYMAAPG
jgi:phosphoribosylformylglycinamidine synthase